MIERHGTNALQDYLLTSKRPFVPFPHRCHRHHRHTKHSFNVTHATGTASSGGGQGETSGKGTEWEGVDWRLLSQGLNRDVKRFMSKRSIALHERRKTREKILKAVNEIAAEVIKDMPVHAVPFGSCATGLDLPHSDLDVVVKRVSGKRMKGNKKKGYNKEKNLKMITNLARALGGMGWAFQVRRGGEGRGGEREGLVFR